MAIVLHEHGDSIEEYIARYEAGLAAAGLPNVPFHGVELLHGHGAYEGMDPSDRKRLLARFSKLARQLPFSYVALRVDSSDTQDRARLESRIRRELVTFAFDRLDYLQGFDSIAVYYDNGQGALSAALRSALGYALARDVADYRQADHSARRLLQVADYVCCIERAMSAYDECAESKTYRLFYGTRRDFTRNYYRPLYRKAL